mmetsp:Transcript_83559/g.132063  ORF Transcript_83559/g.132063 Transcript_83559/m.132063 type:complete len:263 (+) Transcript_83559:121-909(+)
MHVAVPPPSASLIIDPVCHLPKDYFLPCSLNVAMKEAVPTANTAQLDVDEESVDSDEPVLAPAPKEAIAVTVNVTPSMEVLVVDDRQLENCDEIIPNLYLGGFEAAKQPDRLFEQGIRAVVCCNRELEFPSSGFSNRLDYYRVDVEDMGREPIECFLPEATEFIHQKLKEELPVLVHCRAGVSRSSTVLLAYLVEYCGYSLHDAFFKLLRLRPTITPNLGFMDKLKAYEEEKLGVPGSINVDKYATWFQNRDRPNEPDLRPE